MGSLTTIEGVGPSHEAKLKKAGVGSPAKLLEVCATKKGRQEVAEASGLSEKLILTWTNHADLMRIKGIGGEYAELLEAAGVDSVPDLARRNAANLHEALAEVNASKALVRQLAPAETVAGWIAQAKDLPKVVTH